jgi:predicted PurR-regulated permease PerM
MSPERVVYLRTRTILKILLVSIAVFASLQVLSVARQVITWILIALFFALALNPLVEFFQRSGVRRRGMAIGLTYLVVLGAFAALGATFVPILVENVRDFVDAVPGYVDDLTEGRGRLGFLEREYQIVDRVEDAVAEGGASRILGVSGTALSVTKGVITVIVAAITIAVLTFFMLLEGPGWLERFFALLPPESQTRWRNVGRQIYRTVGGFVSGALLIAVVAGVTSSILLTILDVPYAIALGLLVAILDLIPLAGATIAAVLITTIAFLSSSVLVGVIVLVYFIVYQQVENHVLYPAIYSRTVQLSPLAILIAVLVGASLAGVLGALVAIPVAGAIQVVLVDYLQYRRDRLIAGASGPETG